VEYADRVDISTPEGVDLEVELGGLGSRFVAQVLDGVIRVLVVGALAILLFAIGSGVATAVFLVISFAVWFGYDVLFEVLAGGRTPGKRATGLRVVRTGGQPVRFLASAVRNMVRIVDGPATSYIAGIVAIVASKRNQRLGDMAAGTLVVREPAPPRASRRGLRRRASAEDAPPPPPPAPWASPQPATTTAAWDVSAITQEEIAAVRQFLERRWEIEPAARQQLAWQLAEGLRPKVAGAPPEMQGEPLLEQLAAAKAARY
jgi:uncharacterized RDD family membrane protein YckC